MPAEFFDIFGIFAFIIVIIAANRLVRRKRVTRGFAWVVLLVGIGGLIVDLYIVWRAYLAYFFI